MKCTKKQAERIEQLLDELGVYYVSPVEFKEGVIYVHTDTLSEIKEFNAAMDIILQIEALDTTQDSDDLFEAVQEILLEQF
ncbi:MAG: hypothetical protein AAF921_23820 [Cyanobacteria bacterium P01_D01_bin.44]